MLFFDSIFRKQCNYEKKAEMPKAETFPDIFQKGALYRKKKQRKDDVLW